MAHKLPDKPADVCRLVADMGTYFGQLNNESDRGVILSSADLLDWHLKTLARQRINIGNPISNNKKERVLNSFFGGQGMISTFSSVTNFCYGMELISLDSYNSIEIIRDIRNEVAHSFETISFQDSKLIQRVINLPQSYEPIEEKIISRDNTDSTYGINYEFTDYGEVSSSITGCPHRLKFISTVFDLDSTLIMAIRTFLTSVGYYRGEFRDGQLVRLPDEPTSF